MISPYEKRLTGALFDMRHAEGLHDLNRSWSKDEMERLRPAAVLLGVKEKSGALILTRRSSVLKHHPGQIAFPGGKKDKQDQTLTDTALREAHEEIGLHPDLVHVLGAMPTHVTISSFVVTPIVALIPEQVQLTPEQGEVSEIFELPFSHYAQPHAYKIQSRTCAGKPRQYCVSPYGPHYIWGATANILHTLSKHLSKGEI